jgi:hypothetical protein
MPLYEYLCEDDGTVVELLRPARDADSPVEDPEGRGRVFRRKHSTFATGGGSAGASTGASSQGALPTCCPCGKMPGSCQG